MLYPNELRAPVGRGERRRPADRWSAAAALAAGRGAVLRIGHCCFDALAAQKALAWSGHLASHVSRREHGFSKSRLGIATVNRIRARAELAHLAGRIVIDRDKSISATPATRRMLKRNGIVSITAGP